MTVAEQFATNLVRHRKAAGYSQEQLAALAEVHRTEIGHLEHAQRTARIDTLIKLAGALEVSPGELLEGIEWRPGMLRPGQFREGGR
jgi:transcriptional regulator with XRE-family HTH domain